MASLAIRGPGVELPNPLPLYPATINLGAAGYLPNVTGTNTIDLPSGSAIVIPAGQFNIFLGKYTTLQILDPVTNSWRNVACGPGQVDLYESDGINYRLANLTGCPVGAAITNAGAGYTSAPVVTASGHNSTWIAYLGGYVSAVTMAAGASGTGYTMLPLVEIAAPGLGVPATATAALSGSGVGTITVNNAGAGYGSAPSVTIFPNPFDPNVGTIVNAKATATITGSGQVAAVLCLTNGSGNQTAVPTLVFAGGAPTTTAAATAIMCFTLTSTSISVAGSGYSSNAYFTTLPTQTTGSTTAFAQPYIEQSMVIARQAVVLATVSAGTLVAPSIADGGIFEVANPGVVVVGSMSGSGVFQAAVLSFTVGGVTDTVYLNPA